ncbi:MAG: DUF2971 domain-containing protein [Fibromonadales bacterium]|nr:DUF2971 domain-containing protein [Fibromonadales bacterium]
MTTIEDVVKMWDENNKSNPCLQTQPQKGRCETRDNKIKKGGSYARTNKWAVIKLSEDNSFRFEPWGDRTCYVFNFWHDKQTNKLLSIDVGFERRIGESPNTQAFYNFLNQEFNGYEISGKELILSSGRVNSNHLVLKIQLALDSSAEDICEYMKKLIDKTQQKICDFFKPKNKNETIDFSIEEYEIFFEIMKKHKIKKDDKFYGKYKELYSHTIKILETLKIGNGSDEENISESNFSHYTKKDTAYKLLSSSETSEFRLYDTFGINDPMEGKTLLSFLGIKSEENSKLPESLPFVACFISESDSLNQFRLYGKDGDKEATGVSMVFKDSFFYETVHYNGHKEYPIYRCVYLNPENGKIESIDYRDGKETNENDANVNDEQAVFEKWLQNIKDLFAKLKKITQKLLNFSKDKVELARDLLIKIRYIVKDFGFVAEQEYRIIEIRNKKDESIKADGNRFYIEIGKIKKYVSEVCFAPLADGMEAFEIETGIECVRSRHPYRLAMFTSGGNHE